ncbi:VWA domain-containing protein [Streptomyces sp. N2-109]|uniref:VWA domain-containing protein n=1 Tax=Streptomyces gossypii TaxID=2883101 RepID=A0ABT2JMS7_9ACTN|nr:VWA domain-containing protein [Streptomyces gossypii]MCT2589187.1 VWA domain-containing protein [Streptomyces gossypii]
MARHQTMRVSAVVSGAIALLAALGAPGAALPQTTAARSVVADDNKSDGDAADGDSSMVMVLDSSGSMADGDGAGSTRIAAARKAVGTVVDSLPDGYPTGLRVYGADKARGCDDTRLAKPVEALDREGIKQAVAEVEPKGDTPIGLSLRKAGEDLPKTPDGAIGRRSILLVSDGEDTCGTPEPCEVAAQLGGQGIDLRIDAIGFQVGGKARKELQCIAEAGHGSYYDAPDAKALARQLQRAAQLSADGYRFEGEQITGGDAADQAEEIAPGQYLDTIGPGETRWYSAPLDSASTAGFSATAVPQPGVPVGSLDGLEVKLTGPGEYTPTCGQDRARFGQDEGAFPLPAAASRIPSEDGGAGCDEAGTYRFSVTRHSEASSDQGRWPLELRHSVEEPLKKGVTPAQSQPEYGAGGKEAELPTGAPEDIEGGTGFNDAKEIGKGVYRDKLLPAQTRWYKVPVGWGQQLRYDAEFANEPTLDDGAGEFSFVRTAAYSPSRAPLSSSEFTQQKLYTGEPTAVSLGSVPVSWTNRYEIAGSVTPVHRDGDYYIAVTLGADAVEIAENTAIGVVLRVDVKGREKTGPQHNAPVKAADGKQGDGGGDGGAGEDGGGDEGTAATGADDDSAGWTGPVVAAVAGGTGIALLAGLAFAYARARRGNNGPAAGSGPASGPGSGPGSTTGGAW